MSDIIRYHKHSGEFTRYPEDYNFNLETSTDITSAFELEYGIGAEQLGVMEDNVFASFKEELTTELGYSFPNDPYEAIGSIDNTDFPLAHGQLLPHLSGKLPPEHIFRLGQGDWDAIAEIEDCQTRDYVWNKMQGLHELNAWNKPEEYDVANFEELKETISETFNLNSDFLEPGQVQSYAIELRDDVGLQFSPDLNERLDRLQMLNDFADENWNLDDLID
jgi:hypothetical protein